MTFPEFKKIMASLEVGEDDYKSVLNMLYRFCQSYPWLYIGELFSVAASEVPNARAKYNPDKSAFGTWFTTLVRNRVLSYIRKEERQRTRFLGLTVPEGGIYSPNPPSQEGRDTLTELSGLVSPMAWALAQIVMGSFPKRVPTVELSRLLQVSTRSVFMLRKELEAAGGLLAAD